MFNLFQHEKGDIETGVYGGNRRSIIYSLVSRIFVQALTLTFLAEWGDRSQIATIILAAREVRILMLIRICIPAIFIPIKTFCYFCWSHDLFISDPKTIRDKIVFLGPTIGKSAEFLCLI